MKIKLITLLTFVFSLCATAQTNFRFADSTAQWNVYKKASSTGNLDVATNKYVVKGDAIINGIEYQTLLFKTSNNSYTSYVRKNLSQKIFWRRDSVDAMIYDFGAVKGDTFDLNIFPYPLGEIPNLQCAVDSVDVLHVNGDRPRKRMYVTYFSNTHNLAIDGDPVYYSTPDICIEGIGSLYTNFIHPGVNQQMISGRQEFLLCFSEKEVLVYQHEDFSTCDTTKRVRMGIEAVLGESDVKLFPNPVTNDFKIELINNYGNAHFTLYDLTGRMTLQKPLTEKLTQLQLTDVAKGMYLYSITSNAQPISSGKLVVD